MLPGGTGMRVYGSSPLFNYVELIFRSKRLFIVSIILATLAMSGFYFSRAKNYTAHLAIFMTGAPSETLASVDSSQRDTIGLKLQILNIMLKNPQNIKDAMTEANLKGRMSEVEFADFCKRVKDALGFSSDGAYLEISCTWPTRDCEKILNGFYDYYHKYVVDQTTVVSSTRTQMLSTLLKAYSERYHELDMRVRNYQLNVMAGKMQEDFGQANSESMTAKRNVERIGEQIQSVQNARAAVDAKLKTTQPTIEENRTMNGPAQAPDRLSATQTRDAAKKDLDDLLVKLTPQNPKVKSAQEKLDIAQADLDKLKQQADKSGVAPTPGDVTSIKQAANPQYQQLEQLRTDHDLALTRLQSDLKNAQRQLVEINNRLRTAPDEALKLKAMTEDQGLYASMKGQLRGELEAARMNELRDKELKSQGMKKIMEPEAEMEKGGAKGALLLGAGPILGLVIAFCFSLLAESLDHSLRTPMEVEKYLDKPVLAVLPRMDVNKKAARGQVSSGDNNRPSLPS